MGILFNNVDRSDLRVGDHVYSWRTGYTYAHHGIYVGDNDVVHFTKGSNEPELAAKASLIESIGSSSIPKQQHLSCPRYPDSCVLKCENGGVICSCLDCFLEGGSVYRFEYGVSKAVFFAQVRGNCTLAQSDPPDRVIHRARYLHQQNGFGNYDLFSNNCEDFAIYCKTEFVVSRNASGRSGQVAVVKSFCSAFREAYMLNLLCLAITYVPIINAPLLSLTYKPIYNMGKALNFGKNYFGERYEADIGVRVDKSKVPVENLAVYLHSSTGINVDKTKVAVEDSAVSLDSSISIGDDKTKVPVEDVSVFLNSSNGKKPPVEDLAVYLDSSTGNRVDKTKVPVEDAAAFLDSSTCKKPPVEDLAVYPDSSTGNRVDKTMAPVEDVVVFLDSPTDKTSPVAESSTSQAISRNISSKNQKRKLRQQQRRNCQLVQDVEDVAVVLDSSTGKKPLVAESCTSQATSGNGSCKKQKEKLLQQQRRNCQLVQNVDNVGVVLDSSIGKKPPVAESSTSQATSRNGSSKKQKKKLLEQQRRICQLVQDVEDVAVVLDSSTGKKPLVAESCTSQPTSRNESSKKQKKKLLQQQIRNCQLVQDVDDVDDVGVVLDSSIGKKPLVAESSTSQATSRNGSSKKKKKKLLEQERRNCQLVQDVEDVAVVLDSSTGKKPAVAESSTSQATSRNGSPKKKLSQQQRRNCEFVQGPVPRGPVLQGN